jgi:hypothetical protein
MAERKMPELAFNICKQSTCANPEKVRPGPLNAQLFQHERQPEHGIFG